MLRIRGERFREEVGGWIAIGAQTKSSDGAVGEGGCVCHCGKDGGLFAGITAAEGDVVRPVQALLVAVASEEGSCWGKGDEG